MNTPPKFKLGDLVRKTKGSQWSGVVVGTYSTALTPEGYAVESSSEKGSVQIYPAGALEKVESIVHPRASYSYLEEQLEKAQAELVELRLKAADRCEWQHVAAKVSKQRDELLVEVERLKENRPAENQELLAQLETKTRTVQGYRMACDEKVSELNSAQVEIERLKVENAGLEAVIGNQFDKLSALQRKLAAAEGMAKALVPFTCGVREVYPGGPCEDFGFQQKGTSAKVHAALSAYQEASK
jgi:DNA repair exonuclease SbcCD ATPase subunit